MSIRCSIARRSVLLASLAGALVAAAGCSSANKSAFEGQWSEIKGDPTSQVDSTALTHYEFHNRRTVTVDTNFRAMVDDWDRLWLADRPSRLSPYPAAR